MILQVVELMRKIQGKKVTPILPRVENEGCLQDDDFVSP